MSYLQIDAVASAPAAGQWALVAIVLIGVLLAVLLIGLLVTVLKVRSLAQSLRDAVTRIEPSVHPVLERARAVSENVEHITRSIRGDVDRVTESVEALSGRVQQASDRIEERIEEFNAVIGVAQSEAESILLDTAATVHGVRAGANVLRAGVGPSERPEEPRPEDPGSEHQAPRDNIAPDRRSESSSEEG